MTNNVASSERQARSPVKTSGNSELSALFEGHITREFVDRDVDATKHFINQIAKDARVTPISRTIGKDQVVDELIVSFTHNTQRDYLLPGIPPTTTRKGGSGTPPRRGHEI